MTGPLDDLFGALADPTRRFILQRLLEDGPETATQLAGVCPTRRDAPLSRQAIVKHLQVLADVGLATPARAGREVRYTATPEPLTAVVAWLIETGPAWDRRMEKLQARIDRPASEGASPR